MQGLKSGIHLVETGIHLLMQGLKSGIHLVEAGIHLLMQGLKSGIHFLETGIHFIRQSIHLVRQMIDFHSQRVRLFAHELHSDINLGKFFRQPMNKPHNSHNHRQKHGKDTTRATQRILQ